MNPTNSTFQSENLTVDYLSIKFQELEDSNLEKIAHYLFQMGFNSYQESSKLAKPIQKKLWVSPENTLEVIFVRDHTYWKGTTLNFSGVNAKQFYLLLKENRIDWIIFSSGVLSRLDLYYLRAKKRKDKLSIRYFLHQSFEELKQTKRKVSLEQNSKSSMLKIENRRSNLFYRIYDGETFVKFELEMKGKFLEKYHSLLVENRLEEFESQLSSHFLVYSAKTLPLNYPYLEWLVIKLRPIRYQQIPEHYLNSHYLSDNSFQLFSDRKDFLCFLQFVRYAQKLDYRSDSLGDINYRQVVFRLQDFITYQNPGINSNNYRQVKQFINFFDKVQKNSLIKIFTDKYYRSLMTIPDVKLDKDPKNNNAWIVKVWIAEELFYYASPFLVPNFSFSELTKDGLEVQFKSLQIFSSPSLEKKFLIQEFLESYPSVLSNQQKTKIKKLFLKFVDSL